MWHHAGNQGIINHVQRVKLFKLNDKSGLYTRTIASGVNEFYIARSLLKAYFVNNTVV